ncbi:ABC transporter permease [Halomicrobium salinisoli]|uniref:ABC transporter permease n=1 Tax=Halomicrobium salinisoli TaxID=2878391 RepID=UPI001CEFD655|nr:ABC transporter permease [Halomicrobium salinisoli]
MSPAVADEARLFRTLVRKELLMAVRYPLNFVIMFGWTLLLFLGLVFGGEYASADAIIDSLAGVVVGFFLYTMAIRAFQSTVTTISAEAKIGTLQQLYMTPFGMVRVLAYTGVVHVLIAFGFGFVLLPVMLVVTGQTLSLNIVPVVTVAALGLVSIASVGFALGGLAILYKNVSNLTSLLMLPMAALIAAPADRYPIVEFLPLTLSSHLLQRVMVDGLTMTELPVASLGLLVVKAVAYFAVGAWVLTKCQRRARRLGTLGDY